MISTTWDQPKRRLSILLQRRKRKYLVGHFMQCSLLRLTLPACVCCHQTNGTQSCQVSWVILCFSFCFEFKRTIGIIENEKLLTFGRQKWYEKERLTLPRLSNNIATLEEKQEKASRIVAYTTRFWMVMVMVIYINLRDARWHSLR